MRFQPVLHAQNFLLMAKQMIAWYLFSDTARCTFGDILAAELGNMPKEEPATSRLRGVTFNSFTMRFSVNQSLHSSATKYSIHYLGKFDVKSSRNWEVRCMWPISSLSEEIGGEKDAH